VCAALSTEVERLIVDITIVEFYLFLIAWNPEAEVEARISEAGLEEV
jgi:hypothetical protein